MVKKVSACFFFIVFLCFSFNAYAQTRTEWEHNEGEGIVEFTEIIPYHGHEDEFLDSVIPGELSPNWSILTDQENIAHLVIPSELCDANYIDCLKFGQFYYFKTNIEDIPEDTQKVEVSVEVVMDGIRITIFNSLNPDGKDIGFVGQGNGIVEIPIDDIVLGPGSTNTIVITLVDDCCCTNSILNGLRILTDGQTVYTCAPPVVSTRDIIVGLNEFGEANIIPEEVDANSTYECGLDMMDVAPFYFTCNHLGQNTVTLTIKDVKGNSDSGNAIVTVVDNIPPAMSGCPSDITADNDSGECGAVVNWVPPTFTDNCQVKSETFTHEPDSFFTPAKCANGAQGTLVKYTAVDTSNNETTCSFTVTVLDKEAPVVSNCPEDIEVNNDAGECGAVVNWEPPTFTDNCNVASVTSTHNPGDFFPAECADSAVGTVVTYTAVDDCGNETTCSFTVIVLDVEAPVIGITGVEGNYNGLRLDGIYGYWDENAIVFWNTDDIVVSYDVMDNCDPDPVVTYTVEWEGEVLDGVGELDPIAKTITIDPYLLVGDIKVTVNATDYCGNSASDFTEFTVILKVSKTIFKPERFCVNPGKFTGFVWFPDPFDLTTITDAMADAAPLIKMNTCGWCLDPISDICEEYMCEDCEDGCENDEGEYDDDDDECDDGECDDDCDECKCHLCDSCENWTMKAILKFNRYEIPEQLVDRYFVLRGIFEYNGKSVYFQGTDEVKFECNKGGKSSTRKPPKFQMPHQNPWYSGNSFDNGYSNSNWLFQNPYRWGHFWNWNNWYGLPLFYYDD